jgi:hypothetical protein
METDAYAEPIPDSDLPENERLNRPEATDDVKIPAPNQTPAEPEEE